MHKNSSEFNFLMEGVKKYQESYPQNGLVSEYRYFRKLTYLKAYGCWSIISEIVYQRGLKGRYFSALQIARIYRVTEDPSLNKQPTNGKIVQILAKGPSLKSTLSTFYSDYSGMGKESR